MNRRSLLSMIPVLGAASCVGTPAPAAAPLTNDWEAARWIILPEFYRHGDHTIKTQHDNCWTIHHQFMMRTTPGQPWYGPTVHVNSRTYRDWLAEGGYWESERTSGIPPHIQFGGAVVSGQGDPTFHQRWVEYARQEFG